MTNPNTTDEQEAPLDPALERVRRKMLRLLIISSSTIILGLMAVVYSIVYRVNRLPENTETTATATERDDIAPAARQSIALPSGFTVENTAIGGNRILLFGKTAEGQSHIIIHDIVTGKTVTEIELR